MPDYLSLLRKSTTDKIQEFMAGGPKHVSSRACLLALTALGVVGTVASGSWAAVLGGIGLNVGTSLLYDHLEQLKQKRGGRPTFDDALNVVSQMDEEKQQTLQKVAERIDVIPVFFEEALRRQRFDLTTDLRGLLNEWGSTLPFEPLFDQLGRLETALAAAQADNKATQAELANVRTGVSGDIANKIDPLIKEVAALRRQLAELLARTPPPSPADDPAFQLPPRRKRPMRDLTDALLNRVNEESHSELNHYD